MTPVPAIASLDAAMKLAAPGASGPSNVSPEMTSKFQALMNRDKVDSPAHAEGGHNVVGEMIEKQQTDMQRIDTQMDRFMIEAPNMNIHQLSMAQMKLTNEVTLTSVKLTVATSITQGAKGSLQSLLKNQ